MKKIPKNVLREIHNALCVCEMDIQGLMDEKHKNKRIKALEKARNWLYENVRYNEKSKNKRQL